MNLDSKLTEHVGSEPIERLDLSFRTYEALKKHGVRTVGELLRLSDSDMLDLRRFGKKSLADVHEAVEQFLGSPQAQGAQEAPHQSAEVPEEDTWAPVADKGHISEWGECQWAVPPKVVADLDASVELLGLTARAVNVLTRLEVRSIRQLLNTHKGTLRNAAGFGRKSMKEVEVKLVEYLSGYQQPHLAKRRAVRHLALTGRIGTKAFINEILSSLPGRDRTVVAARYGLWDGVTESLQDIGDRLGLTRERTRQIEAECLDRVRKAFGRALPREFLRLKVESFLASQHEDKLGIATEDDVLAAMSDDCTPEEALLAAEFLGDVDLSGGAFFSKSLIQVEEGVYCAERPRAAEYGRLLKAAKQVLADKALPEDQLANEIPVRAGSGSATESSSFVLKVLKVSPSVARLRDGRVVVSMWRELRHRDIASLAQAALNLLGRPAHFTEIAQKVALTFPEAGPIDERVLHNRLIERREKFVWVKRGTYGLAAWGLKRPPYLKDKLVELLSQAPYPLPYRYLKEKSLEVCNCKEASVRMTLDLNPKVFRRLRDDHYGLCENHDMTPQQKAVPPQGACGRQEEGKEG